MLLAQLSHTLRIDGIPSARVHTVGGRRIVENMVSLADESNKDTSLMTILISERCSAIVVTVECRPYIHRDLHI